MALAALFSAIRDPSGCCKCLTGFAEIFGVGCSCGSIILLTALRYIDTNLLDALRWRCVCKS